MHKPGEITSAQPQAVSALPAPVVKAVQEAPGPVPLEVEVISPAPLVVPSIGDWTLTEVSVEHSLVRSLNRVVGAHGDALGAVYARIFHWELDMRRTINWDCRGFLKDYHT